MSKKRGFNPPAGGRGVPGMGGGNMGGLMAQVQKLQEEMGKAQEALGQEELTVSAGGGAVTIVITGHREFKSITIKPEVIDPERRRDAPGPAPGCSQRCRRSRPRISKKSAWAP